MTVLIGSIVGCWFGYYVTRILMYNWVMAQAAQKPTLGAFVSLVRERGFLIIVLMRICPIPFGLQNTLFAIGDIGFVSYMVASLIGLSPEILMLVYMGASLGQVSSLVSDGFKFSPINWAMLAIEIGVSLFLLVFLGVLSRQAMKRVREKQLEQERKLDSDAEVQYEIEEDGVSVRRIDARNEFPSPFEDPSDLSSSTDMRRSSSSLRHMSSLPVDAEDGSCDVWVVNSPSKAAASPIGPAVGSLG
jgi:membrane protein DedA with SNARE-associated domain